MKRWATVALWPIVLKCRVSAACVVPPNVTPGESIGVRVYQMLARERVFEGHVTDTSASIR